MITLRNNSAVPRACVRAGSHRPIPVLRAACAGFLALVGLGLLALNVAVVEAQTIKWQKLPLTCRVLEPGDGIPADPNDFIVLSQSTDDLATNPPVLLENCGDGHTAKLVQRNEDNKIVYDVRTSLKPYGKIRNKDGAITPGKKITVTHKSKIARGSFTLPIRQIARARYRFEVPDLGEATTPVRVTAKRRQKGDVSFIQGYSQIQTLQIRDQATYTTQVSLNNLEGEAIVDLAPGKYFLFMREESSYTATGPQDSKGLQPPFFRTVSFTVEAPKP